jgi:hypothetical protein
MKKITPRQLGELLAVVVIVVFAVISLRPQRQQVTAYPLNEKTMTYTGKLAKHKFTGKGTLKFKNHDYYVGYFKAGRFNGTGTFVSHEGWRYQGHFKAGSPAGSGKLTLQHKVIQGRVKDGKLIDAH